MKEEDRELDTRVTEKVMGWHKDEYHRWLDGQGTYVTNLYSWHPTTNIATAWEVVEHLSTDYQVIVGSDRTALRWWCRIIKHRGINDTPRDEEWVENCETVTEAICLAALKAVESHDLQPYI